jgi:hypothetical protein
MGVFVFRGMFCLPYGIQFNAYLPIRFGHWARSHLRVASAFLEPVLRTNVYVDGFNLYYGALRKTLFRWVNLHTLFQPCNSSAH